MSSKQENWIGNKPSSSDPDLLYKYCQLDSNKERLLENGEIYFPAPSELNDPFDCRVSPNYSDATDREMLTYIGLMQSERLKNLSIVDQHLEKKKLLKQFWEDWEEENFRKEHFEKRYSGIDKSVGVLSFSKNAKSNALWGHYGNSHKGLLVVFNFKNLFESLHLQFQKEKLPTGLFYGNADYSGYPKGIKPIQKKSPLYLGYYFKKLYSYKSPVWEFENEYRVVSYPTIERKIYVSPKCIREVIAGVNISDKDMKKLKQICKDKYTLKQSELIEESFELEYKTVQEI
ncbi:DUF2971 domain-containing protein [Gracilimonas sp.]|uniref:DUF2971 domain-containing protein n=1 Tax=Gracilimonas sp. TaxID=1974203 RepID=UPI0032EC3B03